MFSFPKLDERLRYPAKTFAPHVVLSSSRHQQQIIYRANPFSFYKDGHNKEADFWIKSHLSPASVKFIYKYIYLKSRYNIKELVDRVLQITLTYLSCFMYIAKEYSKLSV